MRQRTTATGLVLLGAFHLIAQTTARQGDSKAEDRTFRSPMIIETVFLPADRFLWKSDWFGFPPERFAGFVCENIWVQHLEMSAKELADGKVRVRLRTTLANGPGHDKWVTLAFRVRNGDVEVAKVDLPRVSVEEHKKETRIVEILVPSRELTMNPITKLEITVTVWDD